MPIFVYICTLDPSTSLTTFMWSGEVSRAAALEATLRDSLRGTITMQILPWRSLHAWRLCENKFLKMFFYSL
jgi:hypothetical protein